MEKLTFRSFTWPRNPEKLQHSYECQPVYDKDSAGDAVFSGMGTGRLTISGSGVFSGDSAYSDLQELTTLFEEGICGILWDPVMGSCNAYLTELELTQEPRVDQIAYRFTFTRANADGEIPKV